MKYLASSLFENVEIALVIAPLILLPLIIYGGFFIDARNSPAWLSWLQWISPAQYASVRVSAINTAPIVMRRYIYFHRYAFTGLVRNELEGQTIEGVPAQRQLDQIGASGRLPIGIDIVLLVTIFLAFIVLSFLGLLWLLKRTGYSRLDLNRMRAQVAARK